jgi:urease accessory protein
MSADTAGPTSLPSPPANDGLQPQALLRLLQLASPTLPIGAFAYSQGLEPAVVSGRVSDEASASRWILGLLQGPVTTMDLAVFVRIHAAFAAGDEAAAWRWNAFLFASRGTAELQAEDRHLGAALSRVLDTLGLAVPLSGIARAAETATPPTFVAMFAGAAAAWNIEAQSALSAFAFTWAEAQVSAAVRLVPLGQSAGVRILAAAAATIPTAVARAQALEDTQVGGAAPLQAILSSMHETQYSRLFRS